jgi:hypothetical protein
MPDATITSTASTFGTISGTFAADQSTVTGTITAITGTIDGSVGVPGPQGIQGIQGIQGDPGSPGAPGQGVAAGGSTGQVLQKLSATSYDTGWLTLPADYITSVSAPLAVASGVLSVDLSTYLPKSGGIITGDIQSYNGSGYRAFNGTYSQVNINSTLIQLINSDTGGNTLSIEWNGITFPSGKQTVHYPGTSILTGYATESWVTAGFAPIAAGQPVAGSTGQVLTKNSGTNYDSIWTTIVPGDRYLTSSTTSNTLSNTTKTFTIGTGLSYTPTQSITISYDASNHMHGEVLTYNSGTGVLTVDINHHTGAGTYAAWVVNVGGVVPATSVGFADITGAVSDNTNLQNALDLKLDATTAASTYYLQTNPDGFITSAALAGYATEYWVGTQDFLTNSAASSTYQTQAGMISYATLGGSTFTGRVQVKASGGGGAGLLIPLGTTPSSPLDGEIWNNGSAGLKVQLASVTETLANQSWVSNAYAPLASPTFSGTPTLPTGTIGTTQSPGNNTTALATTAFVTAAVPAFASTAQSRAATSTTVAQNPSTSLWQAMSPGMIDINRNNLTYSATGTMGTAGQGFLVGRMTMGTVAAASANFRTFGTSQIDQSYALMSKSYRSYIDFSKFTWCSGRFYMENAPVDPNVTAAFYYGKANNSTNGNLARAGFGWKLTGNATAGLRNPVLQVHNGTTLTNVTSSFAAVAQVYWDWDIISLGNGTVTLYINGTQVATTSAGPTADTSYSGTAPVIWNEELLSTAITAGYDAVFGRGRIYVAP